MNVALIGLPQSGKSTLFSALTGRAADPFAPPEPRHGVVSVPDERLDYLAEIFQPKKITEATIDFVDVPGCSLDDAKGQQDWRRLLPTVRQADVLVVVVRMFENASVPMAGGGLDARRDFLAVWDEMIFADLDAVTNRMGKLEAALKKPTRTHEQEKRELATLEKCREALENNRPLATVSTSEEERKLLGSFAFLTEKPVVGVFNVSDDQAGSTIDISLEHLAATVTLSASIEAELAQFPEEERGAFLAEFGLEKPARPRLVRACYEAGGLISFLTGGPEEVRAWPLRKGSTAVEAAGRIHTDLARGFIRAETVGFEELVAHKDMKGVKAAGKLRKEGKGYVVQDGDVMLILSGT